MHVGIESSPALRQGMWGAAFRKKLLAEEGQSLDGAQEPPGGRSLYESRFYSKFAGILQVKLRQHVFGVYMLTTLCGQDVPSVFS